MKKEILSPILNTYIYSITEPSTKDEIRKRLVPFEEFTLEKYHTLIDEDLLFDRLEGEVKIVRNDKTGTKIDVYKYLNDYGEFIKRRNPKISRSRMTYLYNAAKKALNYSAGNLVFKDTFATRVNNLPPVTKNKRTTIDKEQMTNFLHEMMSSTGNLRMQVLTMLLVSSGVRVGEALQIKVKDLNFEANPPRINLPAEITKTGVERDLYLTREMMEILKKWMKFKYRNRTIVRRINGKIVKEEYVKPTNIAESYIFKMRDEFDMNKYKDEFGKDTEINNYRTLYDGLRDEFTQLVDEIFIKNNSLGKKFPNGRRSISFHSLRWLTRTQVKEATNDEALAFFWVGKENVKYEFDATGKKLLEKYKLIEPYLTFLDPKIINKIGEGHQAEIDHLKKQMELQTRQIRDQNKEILLIRFEQLIQHLIREKGEKEKNNLNGISISPEEQLEYFMKKLSMNSTNPNVELIKEMINEGKISEIQLDSEASEAYIERYHDRYNEYVRLGKIDFDMHDITSHGFDEQDNLIIGLRDKTNRVLPPLSNSPTGKAVVSKSSIKSKKMVRN